MLQALGQMFERPISVPASWNSSLVPALTDKKKNHNTV